jgi:hypothetical protein
MSRIWATNPSSPRGVRCMMHNRGGQHDAVYMILLPIGNDIPLCGPCCAWWRAHAAADPTDASIQPVQIRSISRRLHAPVDPGVETEQ